MVDRVRASVKLQHDDSRCQRRTELYSKVRGVDVNDHVSPIDDVNSALAKLEVNTKESLTVLKRAFAQDPSNIVYFLRHKSALHFVVGRLISSEPYEQLEALECICNASLGDQKSCSLVAYAAAIYTIQIVHGTNTNLIKVALTTLGNLSSSNIHVCRLLHEQGLLPALLVAMKVEETRDLAVKTLIQFTYFYHPHLRDDEVIQCVDLSVQFFASDPNVQWLISQLSASQAARLRLSEHQTLPFAAQIMCACRSVTAENVKSVTALVRLLGNCQYPISVSGELSSLEKLLSTSQYPHVRKEFSWMVSQLRNDAVEMDL